MIDTNVLIFDTFVDSDFHTEAVSMLDSIDKWYLPSIVFHEFVWFFKARKIQISRANLKVEEYLTNEKSSFSPCTTDDIRFAAKHMKEYSEYNDLVILSVAKRLNLPLFTFDEDLKKTARRASVHLLR